MGARRLAIVYHPGTLEDWPVGGAPVAEEVVGYRVEVIHSGSQGFWR
jgi:hypothetical protein